jgi:hypothetical protein
MWFQAVVAAGDNDARLCGNWGVLFDEDYSLPSTKKRNKSGCIMYSEPPELLDLRYDDVNIFPPLIRNYFSRNSIKRGKINSCSCQAPDYVCI